MARSLQPIRFSILTPTWNRASYLPRVFAGLNAQTFRNFEWIIADDGSKDGTEDIVRQFGTLADFPITYIRANQHVGKARVDNAAVKQARGEFIVWCDSDDYLLPHAVKRLWEVWQSIPSSDQFRYVGVTGLAATDQGCIVNPFPNIDFIDTTWNDLAAIHNVTQDMLFCARAEALKSNPFPEVDLIIPESVVWTAIGHRPTRLISDVLKIIEYKATNPVSFSGYMAYNRGRAYSLAYTERHLKHYRRSLRTRFWRIVTFLRYSSHGDLPSFEAQKLWGDNSSFLSYVFAKPFAGCLALKDRWQGKVRKTHVEFLQTHATATLTIELITDGQNTYAAGTQAEFGS